MDNEVAPGTSSRPLAAGAWRARYGRVRWALGCLALAWVTVHPLRAAAAGCTMTLAARLPWQMQGAELIVQAALNGKPAQFILDSGAFTSVITETAARRLDLRVMRGEEFNAIRAALSGIGGGRNAIGVTARSVELGGLHARNFNFLASEVVAPPADGLLSTDLISQFDIDLDFPEQQAVLYYPTGDCSAPAAFLASPLYSVPLLPIGEDRRPRVRVQVGDQEVVALIDTGAAHSAIFHHAAERLGVQPAPLAADEPHGVRGIGPRLVASARHTFEAVTLGDLTFGNMKLDVLQDAAGPDGVEMLLGVDFIQKVHLWISYSSHTLIMQYPPRASKKPE